MSTRILLGPREDLVRAVADQVVVQGRDASKTAVVFPGKRPGHFLRRELAQRLGGSFIPPRVFAIDEFVQMVSERVDPEQGRDLETLDAVAVLAEIHRKLPERLGGEAFRSLDLFLPVGFKLFGELEELRMSGADNARIVSMLEPISYDQRHTLGRYYTAFYDRVKEIGRTTRAMRYSTVAERIAECPLEEFERIIVAGLFKLTPIEQRILDALERRDTAVLLFQSDKLMETDHPPTVRFTAAPDVHGQVFALAGALREELDRPESLDDRTVIVLPAADALFPLVEHLLSGLPEERYNIAFGYPLSRTPIMGFLNALLDLLRSRQDHRYTARAYHAFILHPYTKNIRFRNRADVTRVLMHGLESHLTTDRSMLMVDLDEIESLDGLFTRVAFSASSDDGDISPDDIRAHLREIHEHTIGRLDRLDSIGALADAIVGILEYIYDHSTAPLHPLFRPYAETLLESFDALRTSLLAPEAFERLDGYLNLVQQVAERATVPFPGTPLRGLQVLGVLETRGLRFDRVFMLQVTDDVLPGGIGTDMLLPQQVRERLGLETVRDRDELTEHYFRLLVNGAMHVELFYSEVGGTVRSRFVEKLLWEREQDRKPGPVPIRTARYRLQLSNTIPPPIAKTAEVSSLLASMTFSASAVDTYLRCPLRFFYQSVMRMREQDAVAEDLDALEIGTFVHDVLREHFDPGIGRTLEGPLLDPSVIGDVVERQFRIRYGERPAEPLVLMRRQVRKRLGAFIAQYQRQVCKRTPVHIRALEVKMEASIGATRIRGTIDRVEDRGADRYVLDYKSGAPGVHTGIRYKSLDPENRETYASSIGSVQLPFYLMLYAAAEQVEPSRIIPAYLFLGARSVDEGSEEAFGEDPAERSERYRIMRTVIGRLLAEIVDPGVPFGPAEDLAKECSGCPYNGICGTQWAGV